MIRSPNLWWEATIKIVVFRLVLMLARRSAESNVAEAYELPIERWLCNVGANCGCARYSLGRLLDVT